MHHLVALFAVVLSTGIEGFQVDQPAKVEVRMSEGSTVEFASGYRAKIAFNDTPAELAYDFETAWDSAPPAACSCGSSAPAAN